MRAMTVSTACCWVLLLLGGSRPKAVSGHLLVEDSSSEDAASLAEELQYAGFRNLQQNASNLLQNGTQREENNEEEKLVFDPGNPLCPCLSAGDVPVTLQFSAMASYYLNERRDISSDHEVFEQGCGFHHKSKGVCMEADGQTEFGDLQLQNCENDSDGLEYPFSPLAVPITGSGSGEACTHQQQYPECYRKFCVVDMDNCAIAVDELPPLNLMADEGEAEGPVEGGSMGGNITQGGATRPNNMNPFAGLGVYRLGVSYATCGYMDIYSGKDRIKEVVGGIKNRTLRVALLGEPDGWTGLRSTDNVQFAGPWQKWQGPLLTFIQSAANQGQFRLRLTNPYNYDTIVNRSIQYYNGSTSDYDLCVYATATGFVDLCIGDFVMTDRRLFETDWIKLQSRTLTLFVPFSYKDDSIQDDVLTFFYPYRWETWLFMLFFVIPSMGTLFFFFDDGQNDVFMKKEATAIELKKENENDPKQEQLVLDDIPWPLRFMRGLCCAYLGLATRQFQVDAVTLPAKINFYGISFFLFAFGITYTANLAAQLTKKNLVVPVDSFQDAIAQGYRFCTTRKEYEVIMNFHPALSPDKFAVDDFDGKPGFTFYNGTDANTEIMERIDPDRAGDDNRYCHAAILADEFLEAWHAQSQYCDIMKIDDVVAVTSVGIPIARSPGLDLEDIYEYFRALEARGDFARLLIGSKPAPSCSGPQSNAAKSGLTIREMSGIWLVSFGFSVIAIVVYLYENHFCKFVKVKKDANGQPKRCARKRNQWFKPVSTSNVRWIEERSRVSPNGQYRILKSDAYLNIPPGELMKEQSPAVGMGDDLN